MLLSIGYQEILLIALIVLLLFGGAKIPELMRGIGKGVKSFKDGLSGKDEAEQKSENNTASDKENAGHKSDSAKLKGEK